MLASTFYVVCNSDVEEKIYRRDAENAENLIKNLCKLGVFAVKPG
jgi:hypothetical protein